MARRKKKVLYYCQHLLGVGHVTCANAIIRKLSATFDVTYVLGGPPVDGLDLPSVLIQYLPPLLMRESDRSLFAPCGAMCVEEVFRERRQHLDALAEQRFDAVIVEFFPFGRAKFADEILRLIECARANGALIVSSVRDILICKRHWQERDKAVARLVLEHFDTVWVHTDLKVIAFEETFTATSMIEDRIVYTGFVTASERNPEPAPERQRASRIVLSLGGGRTGSELLTSFAETVSCFPSHEFCFITGPYSSPDLARSIRARIEPADRHRVTVSTFVSDFWSLLRTSSLSISMGGYNTVMDVIRTRVPALAYPYQHDREQQIRADRFASLGLLSVLKSDDLESPGRMTRKMHRVMEQPVADIRAAGIDFNGAEACLENLKQKLE